MEQVSPDPREAPHKADPSHPRPSAYFSKEARKSVGKDSELRLFCVHEDEFYRSTKCASEAASVIKSGILNPALQSLLCRVRHTNTLVIADRGFPFWPLIETVDISLIDDVPTVLQVLEAVLQNFRVGRAWMAEDFKIANAPARLSALEKVLGDVVVDFSPHVDFKQRVPHAIGLIRTGDTTQYANIILESA